MQTNALHLPEASDRCSFDQLIASGGTALVFKGRIRDRGRRKGRVIQRTVAIKMVQFPNPSFPNIKNIVRREIAIGLHISRLYALARSSGKRRILRRLGPLLYYEWHEWGALLAFPYRSRGTLKEHLGHRGRPFRECDALQIIRSLARSLGVLHGEGVIHRDLKLDNVLLSNRGSICLTDYGLGYGLPDSQWQKLNSNESKGFICGTPLHIPPEEFQATTTGFTSPRRDIFALGVVLYELLTGRNPFPECSDVIRANRQGRFIPLGEVRHVSPYTNYICGKCLAPVQTRFQDTREVLVHVKAALGGQQTPPRDFLWNAIN